MVRNAVICTFALADIEQIVYKVHRRLSGWRSYRIELLYLHTGCFIRVYTKQLLLHQGYDYA